MSIEWLKWAFEQEVEPGAKLVLLTLSNLANPINPCDRVLLDIIPDDLKGSIGALGWAWPSQDYLQKRCGMAERTIRNHLSKLEEIGLVVAFERRRPDGRKSSDGYLLITSPAVFAADTSPAKNDTTSPAKSAGTYEDTQGLIPESGLTPLVSSVNKPPLPPFSIARLLKTPDWEKVQRAAQTNQGWSLSCDYLALQYDEWINRKGITPSHPLDHFLDFIVSHKRRNKL
ncbi:MAG: helix-turn-helix domain-containing protein [Alphaproteobacteria bacterium]